MRSIKFRAWDKTNKKWLLGYEYENLGGFSLTGECVLFGDFASLFRPLSRLNEIEIMQFTGLKDKNGKEIYEGDIVAHGIYGNKVVCWNSWKGAWYISPTTDEGTVDKDYFIDRNDDSFCEVVGNIYENPELLEVKK